MKTTKVNENSLAEKQQLYNMKTNWLTDWLVVIEHIWNLTFKIWQLQLYIHFKGGLFSGPNLYNVF